ncbi:MAG: SusC/RagA family TonB-linked outer membrane protein [Bacteroidota bacterium]
MSITAKLLRVMKLTALLLTVFAVHVTAGTTEAQTISLSGKNIPLKEVFSAVKKQTGYYVVYNTKEVEATQPVNVNAKDEPLAQFLSLVLKDRGLEYTIKKNTILISKEQKKITGSLTPELTPGLPPPPPTVHGRITNEKGEAVAGVSISIKGGKTIGVTNDNGEFTLTNVADNAVLVFSAINTETLEIKLNGRSELAFSLKTKTSVLDEVQMIAYGSTSKRLQTGNVSTVKGEDIAKQPVSNPLLALEGRVPGLFITQSTGLPGSGVTVRIQGQNSISKGNDPLYVIDGVPYASQMLPTISNILGGSGGAVIGGVGSGGGNPLSFINPEDIESIDVLKDADATAIYGSRAANGAILITTKKGQSGLSLVSASVQEGWGKVANKMDLLNTQQYLRVRFEGKKNDNASVLSTDYDINGTWDSTKNTDWQKVLLGGTAKYTNMQASVSGGNNVTKYFVGFGYHKETTVFPGDLSDQKGSVHLNLSNISQNQKFRFDLSADYQSDYNQIILTDLTQSALLLAPDAPALYNPDGTINWAMTPSGTSTVSTWNNPLSYLNQKYRNKTVNLVTNSNLSYQITKNVEFKSGFGYTNLESNELAQNPLIVVAPDKRTSTSRYSIFGNGSVNSWIIEPQILIKQNIGHGKLDVLIGGTLQQTSKNQQTLYALGYSSDGILEDIRSATSIIVTTTLNSTYNYSAIFGRLNYNYRDKYILNVNVRSDGSSRFGADNLFHRFGSFGGAWIFSKEKFSQSHLKFLSFGKVRASYGTTGNDQIGDYQFLSLYTTPSVAAPYQGATGLQPTGLTNPYLQWEETRKIQAGIDVGFFSDRIIFGLNYYLNRSSNQLLAYAVPITTGFSSITTNLPATIQNQGWELSLNSINIKSKNFSWSANLNLTIPTNKLVDFPNLESSALASSYSIGEPITLRKLFHFVGVDPATGVYQFTDSRGNLTSTPNSSTDRTVLINTAPSMYGGIGNSFRYKEFQLDILFQFVKQEGLNYFFGNKPGQFFGTSNIGNQPAYILSHWQNPGDIVAIQRYSSTYPGNLGTAFSNAQQTSDVSWSDASYLRLKNLSLSWQLPVEWQKKIKIQDCRFFLQAQNLFTVTNFKGLDPENQSVNSLPPLRVVTVGIKMTL